MESHETSSFCVKNFVSGFSWKFTEKFTSGCPLSRGNVLKCQIFLHKIEKQIKDTFVHNSTTATTDFHFKFCKKPRTFIYKEKDFPFIIFIFLTIIIIICSRRKKNQLI